MSDCYLTISFQRSGVKPMPFLKADLPPKDAENIIAAQNKRHGEFAAVYRGDCDDVEWLRLTGDYAFMMKKTPRIQAWTQAHAKAVAMVEELERITEPRPLRDSEKTTGSNTEPDGQQDDTGDNDKVAELSPAESDARALYLFAMSSDANLTTDQQVYEFLKQKDDRDEMLEGYSLSTREAFKKNLGRARKKLGTPKRTSTAGRSHGGSIVRVDEV